MQELRNRVLSQAVKLVPQYGWSRLALAEAAKMNGLPSIVAGIAPKGQLSLISFGTEQCNEKFNQKWNTVQKSDNFYLNLEQAIYQRIMIQRDILPRWRDALNILTRPSNFVFGSQQLHDLSTHLCHISGDDSFNTRWYTRRLATSTIYASADTMFANIQSQSVGVNDSDDEYEEVLLFIRRALDAAQRLEATTDQSQKMLSVYGTSLIIALTK
ncbi:hypothetical protein MP228_010524 [Amoeboaphelidium protococcarum]|nr:hypothetical protein MP228_010524 [Amoeboaphelidium protococcarum]